MILVAHPEKAKPQSEKEEMDARYKPGDKVLPELKFPRRTAEQLRLEERDRQLIDEVRQMSLREAVNELRRRAEQAARLSSDTVDSRSGYSRTSSSGSRRTSDETLERQRRQIEHQSSLRSLISSSDAADIDIEREVEEFARQIQEEGLLDGLDLDNIDLTNNDELSRRITEAYRRRQRDRERQRREARERSRAVSRHSYSGPAEAPSHERSTSDSVRPTARHSRTPSATSQSDERSRPPPARMSGLSIPQPQQERTSTPPEPDTRIPRTRPKDIVVQPPETQAGASARAMGSLMESPVITVAPYKPRSPLFEEPSITCDRCAKEDIQYELHYNCAKCHDGHWNICLTCYRLGKGCLHWFGFGYGGFNKWERQRIVQPSLPEPHKLLASRFVQPAAMIRSPDNNKQAWSSEDPYERLQSGTFCALCLSWTNDCYWRCDTCNDGDWGFCNDCVNQGRSCTHALLPLVHQQVAQQTVSPPPSPHSPSHPSSATMMVGLNATSIGPFKVLTFITTCDVCRSPIPPTQSRLHCFECVSSLVSDSRPGDYDICEGCYDDLVNDGAISPENGSAGWRRCPQGHRMVIVGFQEGKSGQKRYVVRDLVGGRRLSVEDVPNDTEMQRWIWYEADAKRERLVARDVSQTATQGSASSELFPPDGGFGWKAVARWAWYPAETATDELMFPKGAGVSEIEDANGEWYHGVYMGNKGLFPAPYVVVLEEGSTRNV
ncbi:hypothetical protein M406DRAFT_247679 [Cryphonectria parasitica EP155]|uniref:SH3 domain-containing protein n=1 Tax=Cryphonectria parasitica (strain ATCC 38755 / EP155) TaxID=660469 RepID=A0A9P4YAP8_CRYP1|nr:uncharacterized protein M406DRAFT_247679 [Cryphonectria parasitica EP155]KAF3770124.1 hypothetical protein M406DRAFT_247679 [Cryphonectria parasitica EP155]